MRLCGQPREAVLQLYYHISIVLTQTHTFLICLVATHCAPLLNVNVLSHCYEEACGVSDCNSVIDLHF